jgi:hypothetical protein
MGLRIRCRSVHSLVQTGNYWRMVSTWTSLGSRESRPASCSLDARADAFSVSFIDLRRFSASSIRSYKSGMGGPRSSTKVRVGLLWSSVVV